MKKQLVFTLLLSAIIGPTVFAQDAPNQAIKKPDDKVNPLPPGQTAPTQGVVRGSSQPAQKTGKAAAPGTPDASRPKAKAVQAPIQEKTPVPAVYPQQQK